MAKTTASKPYAIARLVRGEDGGLRTIYVDAKTNKQLDSLNGYEVYGDQNYLDPNTLSGSNQPTQPTDVTENPLTEKEDTKKPGLSGGETKDSRDTDRTGFNAYGPEGKDITDTKLGRAGVGLMGGMAGKLGGAVLGGVVGGPVGALVGGLAGGVIGKNLAQDTSPYAKRQKEVKKKEEIAEAKTKPSKREGIITQGVSKAKSLIDGIFDGTVTDDNIDTIEKSLPANDAVVNGPARDVPTPTARPDAVSAVSRPNNPLGVGYAHPERGPWQAGLTPDTIDAASRLTGTIENPQISSAYRSPAINAAVGGAKKSAHTRGLAFDMSTNNMTDDEKQKAVEMARLSGISRIGTYPDESLHFDMLEGFNPANFENSIPTVDNTYGMYNRTAVNAINRAPSWFTAGMMQDRFAPTPTAKPSSVPATGFVSQDERTKTGNAKNFKPGDQIAAVSPFSEEEKTTGTAFDNIGPRTKEAVANSRQLSEDRFAGVNIGTASPAKMSSLGFTGRTPAEVASMARAIAGELGPNSLKALTAEDPKAQQELANIVASIENRAASKKFGTLEKTLNPSQYNSLAKSNLKTTNANYAKYGPVIEKNINSFLTGNLQPTDYNVTSYYNPEISNPSWGNVMKGTQLVGEHRFGVLDGPYDYEPGSAFKAERARMAAAQVSDTRGFTPSKDYSGRGFSGNQNSPSEGGSRFGGSGLGSSGYSGSGGKDSPSEGGSRFGGSGLGSGIGRGSGGSAYGNSGTGSGGLAGGRGGMVSGENAGRSSNSGGLGRNSDKSDNGWGGRSGSV